MAARRNELSAQAFSRRRTVAAFLRPGGGGNDEDAPRALRAIVPGMVVGALAVAGFGGYGLIRPTAPLNWKSANAVIVGRQSTTRYVWLKGALHPVLNMASARLLLGAGSTVVPVDDSVLNSVPHGATLGIPYAPDSLPTVADAGTPKVWAYCERSSGDDGSGAGGDAAKLFVLGGADSAAVTGAGSLDAGHALYVQGPDGATYLVDRDGASHLLRSGGATPKSRAAQRLLLATAVFGATVGPPQAVSRAWLATIRTGDPVSIPLADLGGYGDPTDITVGQSDARVGDLFQVKAGSGDMLGYVVLADGVHKVSPFTFQLLAALRPGASVPVVQDITVLGANLNSRFEGGKDWPQTTVAQTDGGVLCSVYSGTVSASGVPQLALWAGDSYPLSAGSGAAGVHVTPGVGLIYREVTGTGADVGGVNLLTDTGLRCPVQMDGDAEDRLGYGKVDPLPVVPRPWPRLLSAGPDLTSAAAGRQQGS